ncbi:hypothetical protein L7F22_016252 [Adiantum nelumboides]|nr:hypothetical protein [Adiantum nelumboides]
MARSTLELLLESIKDRDEEPPDHLPALPQRPTSRARLPSRKITSALLQDATSKQLYGGMQQQPSHTPEASEVHSNGNRQSESHPAHCNGDRCSFPLQNGYNKQTDNGEQVTQDNARGDAMEPQTSIQELMSINSTEKRLREQAGLSESALLSKKQAPAPTYLSLKKRRVFQHLDGLQKDSRVWMLNDKNVWVLGIVQSTGDSDTTVVCKADDKLTEIPFERLLPVNPEFLDEVDDLVQLSYVHEPAVFHVLQQRYELGMFCTSAGPSSIVLTPPKQETPRSCFHSFQQTPVTELNSLPVNSEWSSVHAVIGKAHASLTKNWKNQSIIIGGECSVGRTESVQAVLQRLTSPANNDHLRKTLLNCNLILEALGNTRIGSGVSASRYGKLIHLNFDTGGNICSARVQTLILEKSRVVYHAEGEHSYHIFYQLCEGADSALRERLSLRDVNYYNYLRSNTSINGAHLRSDFQSLLNALHALGLTEKNQQDIFSLLGAILWLGNVTSVAVNNNEAVDNAANLLSCSKKDLLKALGCTEDVSLARDALAGALYERLFNWLVAQINKALDPKLVSNFKSITLVDIPGFGFSKSDSLESSLLNYAQEHLQHFTQWHLLQQGEEVAICGGVRNHTNNASSDDERLHFLEYASYNVEPFLKEMNASLDTHTSQILQSCMDNLLEKATTNKNDSSWKSIPEESSLQRHPFQSGQERVLQMMQQLEETEPHFIFCMSPSESKLPQTLDQGYVVRQLRIIKIIEAVRLCRSGFLVTYSHELFASRFGMLLCPDMKKVHGALGISAAILHELHVPSYMYQMGWTRIFLCPEQVDMLECARKHFLNNIISIQKTFRGFRSRKQLEREKWAVTHLQAFVRGWLIRRGFSQHGEVEAETADSLCQLKGGPKQDIASSRGRLGDLQPEEYLPKERRNITQVKSSCGDMERMQTMDAELAFKKKEEEISRLQQSVKEYERKWIAYEAKMKSMEEMWQKQVTSLEQRLRIASKGSNTEESAYKTGDSDKAVVISTPPHYASTRDTAETTSGEPDAVVKDELDPSRAVIDNLGKELEHRTQVFNDDARFLVEVKSGQIAANFKPDEELQKLRQRFEAWKKDYKGRLKETKGILKKLGKSDTAEKNRKRWWSRK